MSEAGSAGRRPADDRRGSGPSHRDAAGRERGDARAQGAGHRSAQAPGERSRRTDPAREAAFEVLREVSGSDAYANLVLPPLLRRRRIVGRDAAFATELAYGTLRMLGYYDAVISLAARRSAAELDAPLLDVLRLGVHQLLGMRTPAHAAVSETVALARSRVGAGPAQLVNAVLRRVSEADGPAWAARVVDGTPEGVERLALTSSHPVWVVRALRQALLADGRGEPELDALLEADNLPAAVTLVARPGLAERDEVVASVSGGAPGSWTPTAVRMPGGDPAGVPGVAQGRVGVQDEGSQLVALALTAVRLDAPGQDGAGPGPAHGERWLDLCAGPGGKAALLGAVAAGRGAHLVASELAPHRAELVRQAVAGLPDGVVEVRTADGRAVGELEPSTYDRVLVDAPCTGLGALRRRPESRWRRQPSDLVTLTATQRALLGAALDATRPGGVVAYVTCSPHVAETELVVRDVLAGRQDAERLDARDAVRSVAGDIPLGAGPGVQLWPHVHGTDAMHLSLIRRR